MRSGTARVLGLLAGYAADRILGDPRRGHPVAGFGCIAATLEQRMYSDSRARGVAYEMILVGGSTAAAVVAAQVARRPMATLLLTTVTTWAALGGRSLEREALAVHHLIESGDLPGARIRLRNLVGRDTAALSADDIARAVIESVAENTSDAVVTTCLWAGLAGIPGLIAHRTANTLDAMVGHHNDRYEHFGWAAARWDDLLGYPGARFAGLITMALGPDRRAAMVAWRRDAAAHPSPNAGVIEASFAGALGITLGGSNTYYGNRHEERARMGTGPAPVSADIPRATRLAGRVGMVAALAAAGITAGGDLLSRRS